MRVFVLPLSLVALVAGSPLNNWTPDSSVNADEMGDYFEGDIVGPLPTYKNGLIDEKYRWKDGVVPYVISETFAPDKEEVILKAFQNFFDLTKGCIKFVEWRGETDYFKITNNDSGCHSAVGRRGGKQTSNIESPGCLRKVGIVEHELLHTLGFHHEQSRPDRDDYVTIMWENISEGHRHNFNKYSDTVVSGFGQKYDYGSVMHYSRKSFSLNGNPTIVPKDPDAVIGQRSHISEIDIKKLMVMYNCPEA
ncbi:meprin A subunit beta-like [Oratosquilla oratoria]|uniref:meprin A subunit beta-like n=1 Tax=Oratosquilla oratoria TaxID=337810 RepID=UPI003F75F76A